jgi:hypothetical protein
VDMRWLGPVAGVEEEAQSTNSQDRRHLTANSTSQATKPDAGEVYALCSPEGKVRPVHCALVRRSTPRCRHGSWDVTGWRIGGPDHAAGLDAPVSRASRPGRSRLPSGRRWRRGSRR